GKNGGRAVGSVVQLAWICFEVCYEVGEIFDGEVVVGQQHKWSMGCRRNKGQIPPRVNRHAEYIRVDGQPGTRHEQQGVPVSWRLADGVHADDPIGAWLVLDIQLLIPDLRDLRC